MIAALGGALRRGKDGWVWSDGQPAPQVRDLDASKHYNFRVRRVADGHAVEVPMGMARENHDLAWVIHGHHPVSWDGDMVGPEHRLFGAVADPAKRAAQVYLVPWDDWQTWAAITVIGAEWDVADEPAILARAQELGWDG